MKHVYLACLTGLTFFGHWSTSLYGQEAIIRPDTFCVSLDDLEAGINPVGNVIDNDSFLIPDSTFFVFSDQQNACFRLNSNGQITIDGEMIDGSCCDEYRFTYTIFEHDACGGDGCTGEVLLKIECPKPDCALVDLTDLIGGDGSTGNPEGGACIQACENGIATYYTSYTAGFDYQWDIENGTILAAPAPPPAQVSVQWGSLPANAALILYETDLNGNIDTIRYCVEMTPAPVPDFSFTPGVCRDQPVCFTNNSTGAVDYLWDFGDGNFSTLSDPCHVYTTGGTYTVTLFATSGGGTNPQGDPLCCCTDSISMEVEVDPLPGPNIYWVSTLCENDESIYWTDATGCTNYAWQVTDADGNMLIFGTNTTGDTITVNWGAGPFGTISLIATGCVDDYCPNGTTVTVPIISSTGEISGPDSVCLGETFSYDLPKWNSVVYDWQISGGTIVGSSDGHSVTVIWDQLGLGNLSVTYGSEFLAGLPGHEGNDCFGSASLDVLVRGNFDINDFNGGFGCLTGNSFLSTTSDFSGATFSWAISPGPVSFSTFGGGASINIDWSTSPGPGTYTVTAVPLSPGPEDYCIPSQTIEIEVISVDPPQGILGPDEYCVGDTSVYTVDGADPSLFYQWTVGGGSILSGFGSPTVVVHWTSAGGGSVSVANAINAPIFCFSDPISISVNEKTLLPISGLDNMMACINSIQTYTALPAQHPDAVFTWSVNPTSAGTVVGGQGSPTVTVQWNQSTGNATLAVLVELCDQADSLSQLLELDVPVEPVIVQIGDLCPGLTARLEIDSTQFSSILWSTGATTGGIDITSGGPYVVNTIDMDGCASVDAIVPIELPGPNAQLSVAGPSIYCVPDNGGLPTGDSVDLLAFTNPNYGYQWFCNNVLQPVTGPVFTHDITGASADFDYYFIVLDSLTGCYDTSQVRRIEQEFCNGGGPGCMGTADFEFAVDAVNQTGNCDIVDLSGTISAPVFDIEWYWPMGIGISIASPTVSGPNLSLEFPEADCYTLRARHFFTTTVGDTCFADTLVTVCIPLVADFEFADTCGVVSFTDFSTSLPPTTIANWSWDFGDGNFSTAQNPTHTYGDSGPYTVILKVVGSDNCVSEHSIMITPGATQFPAIDFSDGPYCVDEAISFMGSASGAIQYNWDFGDGSTFVGQNPLHAYALPNTYTVSLTTENAIGCLETVDTTITVSASPTPVDIAVLPSNVVCEGETITLSVPAEIGVTYEWSNGDTGNSTAITSSGIYTVSLFTADSCVFVADSVELTFIPPPPATVSGNPFICSGDPAVLSGPSGPYSYYWLNMSGDTVAFTQTISLGLADLPFSPYQLIVTNSNGCFAISDPIDLQSAVAPMPTIVLTSGSGCEGEPNVLSIASPDPNLLYTWSTGDTGPMTTVVAAGTYSVVALDPATGCTGEDDFVINPLPDLCLVPVGCYESCNPDTICGPINPNWTYQWYQDGLPLSDETDPCLIATETGNYSLEVTNEFGCTDTSDSLYLDLIDCEGCDTVESILTSLSEDDCCYAFSYLGLPAGIVGVEISTTDASLIADPASVGTDYQLYVADTNIIQLGATTSGSPIPSSSSGTAVEFCLENATSSPQTVIISYLDLRQEVVCADTFLLACLVEPPCVYVSEDTITCAEDGSYEMTVTICRPADADFDIGFVQFLAQSTAAEADFPLGITLSPSLSMSNPCTTLTIPLTTTAPPDELFCYSLVAHSGDPDQDPTALCCTGEAEYCIVLPDCDPCDDLGVLSVEPSGDLEECCYFVNLFNDVSDPLLDGIQVCALDSGATLGAFTSLGGDWTATVLADGSVLLNPVSGSLPLGDFFLPELCIDDVALPETEIILKWLSSNEVICRDTIVFECKPDCGYLTFDEFGCEDDFFFWGGELHNATDFPIDEAYFSFDTGSGLSVYDTLLEFGTPIPPGGSFPIELEIGSPAGPGDSICVQVYLHEENDDEDHLNCCDFKAVIVMPDCSFEDCACGVEFVQEVLMSFDIDVQSDGETVVLTPRGNFLSCDLVRWELEVDGGPRMQIGTGYVFTYTLPPGDAYRICMNVLRTLPDGTTCSRRRCRNFNPSPLPFFFPNPTTGRVFISPSDQYDSPAAPGPASRRIELYDLHGQLVSSWRLDQLPKGANDTYELSLSELSPGMYLLRYLAGDIQRTERLVIGR